MRGHFPVSSLLIAFPLFSPFSLLRLPHWSKKGWQIVACIAKGGELVAALVAPFVIHAMMHVLGEKCMQYIILKSTPLYDYTFVTCWLSVAPFFVAFTMVFQLDWQDAAAAAAEKFHFFLLHVSSLVLETNEHERFSGQNSCHWPIYLCPIAQLG